MMGIVRKYLVQVNQIAYNPLLFTHLVVQRMGETHPTQHDESDEIEKDKLVSQKKSQATKNGHLDTIKRL